MKKRRNQLILSLLIKKILIMMINGIDFKWSGVKEEEEDVALTNFIENLQKQTDEEIFKIKVTRWLQYRT